MVETLSFLVDSCGGVWIDKEGIFDVGISVGSAGVIAVGGVLVRHILLWCLQVHSMVGLSVL